MEIRPICGRHRPVGWGDGTEYTGRELQALPLDILSLTAHTDIPASSRELPAATSVVSCVPQLPSSWTEHPRVLWLSSLGYRWPLCIRQPLMCIPLALTSGYLQEAPQSLADVWLPSVRLPVPRDPLENTQTFLFCEHNHPLRLQPSTSTTESEQIRNLKSNGKFLNKQF